MRITQTRDAGGSNPARTTRIEVARFQRADAVRDRPPSFQTAPPYLSPFGLLMMLKKRTGGE
jgi:hypothetical protein